MRGYKKNYVLACFGEYASIGTLHSAIQRCALKVRKGGCASRKTGYALPTLKTPFRKTALFVFAMFLAQNGSANLVQNGTFTDITYSGSVSLTGPYFGQIGPDTGTNPPATGATLTVTNWSTNGYNFVFNASNVDRGNSTTGANAGAPHEAPGQFNVGNYGNTYMWGSNNGGNSTWVAPPSGGNFIAADGAYEQAPIKQTITGLTVGKTYVLKFWYGAAQQEGYTGSTTDQWTVSMGTGNVAGNFKTPVINLASQSFSGWTQATFYFIANSTSEVLSFSAAGTPDGEPPFALLAGVDLEIVPDISNWMIFAGFGGLCISLEAMRRRRGRINLLPAI